MRPNMGAATLGRVYATARSFARYQYKRGRIAQDRTTRVHGITVSRPRVRVWEPEEAGRFLDWLEGRDERLAVPIRLAMFTGLRRGEVAGLSWLDVELDRARLIVRQQVVQVGSRLLTVAPKTRAGEYRAVDLDADTVAMLRRHLIAQNIERDDWGNDYQDHGLVSARENGAPLAPEALTRGFPALVARYNAEQRVSRLEKEALAALASDVRSRRAKELSVHKTPELSGVVRRAEADADYLAAVRANGSQVGTPLPVIKFHALRHLQASLMLAAGVPLAIAGKRLGHSSVALTSDTYSHLLAGVGADAATSAAALVPRNSNAVPTPIPHNGGSSTVDPANITNENTL